MSTWQCYVPERKREAAEASIREYARATWEVEAETEAQAAVALIRAIEARQPIATELVPPDLLAEWFVCEPVGKD